MPKPKAPVPPQTMWAPHPGLDRWAVRETTDPPVTPILYSWMKELYLRSNASFCGVYLTDRDDLPTPKTYRKTVWRNYAGVKRLEEREFYDNVYARPSGNRTNGWTEAFPTLEGDGWGALFFYVGYSYRPAREWLLPPYDAEDGKVAAAINEDLEEDQKYPSKVPSLDFPIAKARERGALHAEHVKKILRAHLPNSNGAVVVLDNEGGMKLDESMIQYFSTFFQTLKDPGPDLFSIRPGFYSFPTHTSVIYREHPDVFLWFLGENGLPPSGWLQVQKRPWTESPGNFHLESEHFPIQIHDLGSGDFMIPFGWQVMTNESQSKTGFVFVPLKPGSVSPTLRRMPKWDVNVSLVRDPRYPEASPRFAVLESLVVRGEYCKVKPSPKASPVPRGQVSPMPEPVLAMLIREAGDSNANPVDGEPVEPDAPILLDNPDALFTILKSGNIGTSRRTEPGQWTPLISLVLGTSSPPRLRRLRAISCVSPSDDHTELFYVGDDCKLYGTRSLKGVPWSAPADRAQGRHVHPLSNIASAHLQDLSIDAFFIDTEGLLCATSCSITAEDWTGKQHMPIQDKPATLLPTTALMAMALSEQQQLVFAIGQDLQLYVTVFTRGHGWRHPYPVRPDKAKDGRPKHRVFAHSRMAAVRTAPNKVVVACIRNDGVPCVYVLRLDGVWLASEPPLELDRKVTEKTVPNQGPSVSEAGAKVIETSWTANPFGDIHLAKNGSDSVVMYCVGTAKRRSGILMQKINVSDYRAGELIQMSTGWRRKLEGWAVLPGVPEDSH